MNNTISNTRSLANYAGEVWKSRLFWYSLALLDLRKRYRRSALGVGWSMIQPAIMAVALCIIFSGAFGVDTWDHFPWVLSGLCVWNFLQNVVREGCGSIFWSETYIRQHRAPLAIYPLRVVLASMFHLLAAMVPVIVASYVLRGGLNPVPVATLPLSLFLLLIFGWSIATIAGLSTVYVPDIAQMLEVVMQLAFYATPIIYRPEMLRGMKLQVLLQFNPFAAFLNLIRQPLLEGLPPSSASVCLAISVTSIAFMTATFMLAKLERSVIFRL